MPESRLKVDLACRFVMLSRVRNGLSLVVMFASATCLGLPLPNMQQRAALIANI